MKEKEIKIAIQLTWFRDAAFIFIFWYLSQKRVAGIAIALNNQCSLSHGNNIMINFTYYFELYKPDFIRYILLKVDYKTPFIAVYPSSVENISDNGQMTIFAVQRPNIPLFGTRR